MNIEQVREYTLSLFGVTEDQPFGDDNITFRLEGKIFMCLSLGGDEYELLPFIGTRSIGVTYITSSWMILRLRNG